MEKNSVTVEVLLKSKSASPVKADVMMFCFAGQIYAYVIHRVHMHKPPNYRQDMMFDSNRSWS